MVTEESAHLSEYLENALTALNKTLSRVREPLSPRAQIVDISHGVAPFAIAEGAYLIAQAYPYFSKNTVHVVVVDPGVGSARRPIVVEAAGQYFVAPDNGVLEMIYARENTKCG